MSTKSRAKLPCSTHKREVENIRKLITSLGGKFWLTSQGHWLRGSAGIPDAYVHLQTWIPERLALRFWVEVKVGNWRLSDEQANFRDEETMCGGTVIVGGVTEAIAYLRSQGVQIL